MFKITERHKRAFEEVCAKDFERRMLEHFEELFPEEYERSSSEELLARIHEGIEKAASFGLLMEYDVCLFLTLMFALGAFWDDPGEAHLRDALEEAGVEPSARIERAYALAMGDDDEEEAA